jgi:tetratricopeptide (TPR) repeat protein
VSEGRRFFPMYCSASAISGFGAEKEKAEQLLAREFGQRSGMVLLPLENNDWVYGQATFHYPDPNDPDPDPDGLPLKFLERHSTLVSNRALSILAVFGKPEAILFTDAALMARLERNRAYADVKHLFRLITAFAPIPRSQGIFANIRDRFGGSLSASLAEREPTTNEADVAREGIEIHKDRLRDEQVLRELVLFVYVLYAYCALDVAHDTLVARAAARQSDPVGRCGLAMLLSALGDHEGALAHAREAVENSNPPPEALLWFAKESWVVGDAAEGLVALERLGTPPTSWPAILKRGAFTVRAALQSKAGDHAASAATLEQAIDLHGGRWALHFCLAQELRAAGRNQDAAAALETCAVLDPNNLIVQVEQCRQEIVESDRDGFTKKLAALTATEAGRFEAQRFEPLGTADQVNGPENERFAVIDAMRAAAITASILPDWTDICDGSSAKTMFGLHLLSAHRGEEDWWARFSNVLRVFEQNPLDLAALRAMAAIWRLLERPAVAVGWARSALALSPNEPDDWSMLADVLEDAGDADGAFEIAQSAIELGRRNDTSAALYVRLMLSIPRFDAIMNFATDPDGRPQLASIADQQAANPEFRPVALFMKSYAIFATDPQVALQYQREALALVPDRVDFLDNHILFLEMVGDLDAVEAAKTDRAAAFCRTLSGMTAEGFAVIANICLDHEQPTKAEQFVRSALYLDKDLATAKFAQARLLAKSERGSEAIELLRELTSSEEEWAGRARRLLAEQLGDLGRREEALVVWTQQQSLDSTDAAAFLGAGVDLWLLDRDEEAASVVAQAIRLNDEVPYAWGLHGRILQALGKDGEAIAALERAMLFENWPGEALRSLVRLLCVAKRGGEALDWCDHAVLSRPNSVEALIARCEALGSCGRGPEAEQLGTDWAKKDKPSAVDLQHLLRALERGCGLGSCIRAGEIALAVYPESVVLLIEHAWNLSAVGQFEAARTLVDRAARLEPANQSFLGLEVRVFTHSANPDALKARDLINRLRAGGVTPQNLRRIADVNRAAGLDARSAYEQALEATQNRGEPAFHDVAWCELNIGEIEKAKVAILRASADDPGSKPAAVDRALICFLADEGAASGELFANTFADIEDRGARLGYLVEIERLIPQWRRQRVASKLVLDRLAAAVALAVQKSRL